MLTRGEEAKQQLCQNVVGHAFWFFIEVITSSRRFLAQVPSVAILFCVKSTNKTLRKKYTIGETPGKISCLS